MKVQFHRTGERRYAIVVLREGQEPLRMDSAPGYDSLMPHDLQHLIVEQELGIRLGIFGQIAAGGTAGTFHHLHNGTEERSIIFITERIALQPASPAAREKRARRSNKLASKTLCSPSVRPTSAGITG